METIIKEFKKENTLPDDCIQIIRDEEEDIDFLHVSMPTLDLVDEFIHQLTNNLVPAPSPKTQEKIERKEVAETKEIFNPSPINIKPW